MKTQIPAELSPCGVWCGACPSYQKTCLGCSSEVRQQKRSSKFGCRIRLCAYEQKKVDFCMDCENYPCKIHLSKLGNSHPGDARFNYRRETLENFRIMKDLGFEMYIRYQRKRYACEVCGGLIHFYHYTCSQCGRKQLVE